MIIGFGQDVRPKGRVPEWSNGVLSKSIERAIVPGVRIPPLPPYFSLLMAYDFSGSKLHSKVTPNSRRCFIWLRPSIPHSSFISWCLPRGCHPGFVLSSGLLEDSGVLRIGNDVGVLVWVLDHVVELFAFAGVTHVMPLGRTQSTAGPVMN